MLYRIGFLLATVVALAALSCCGDASEGNEQKEAGPAYSLEAELPDSIFYWRDVVPIVYTHCTPCHHEGGAGPFPLTGFLDAKKRTKTIRQVIADNVMPPWPADTLYSRFKGEKMLNARQKATLLKWIDQNAPEGTKPDNLPQPEIFAVKGLGKPDTVLSFPDTVFIAGNNIDKFRIAKIPFELPRDTIVRAISFVPGNRQLVHHVNGHLINYAEGKKKDPFAGEWIMDAEAVNSLSAYEEMKIPNDDGSYPPLLVSAFNYLPGVEPPSYPPGIGAIHFKKKGAFILNTLHYGPVAVDTFDLSKIELYYAKVPPERPLRELQMGSLGATKVVPEFVIPAGEVAHFSTRYKVPAAMSVLTINPHMHLLGKEFTAFAVSPNDKDTIPLIHIPQWDFRWQFFYTFKHMLKIPKGYEIVVNATFDNTIDNPYNPFMPPRTIRESGRNMKTTDEMFQFFITYVPYHEGDEKIKL